MSKPGDPKYAHVPILDQVEAARRALAQRYKVCERDVRDGHMTRAAADREIATARAIRDTLVIVAQNRDELAAVIRAKRERERDLAALDEIRREPAVAAVLDAFPGADIGLPGDRRTRIEPHDTAPDTADPINPETEDA